MPARILIADDSTVVRACLYRLLDAHRDWEVCGEAADGEEAVRRAEQLNPDLVIMDFVMPGMNGIDAARHIRENSPDTPILLCTIALSKELIALAHEAGIAGAIPKADLSRIVPCVERLLLGEMLDPPAQSHFE